MTLANGSFLPASGRENWRFPAKPASSLLTTAAVDAIL
jgi:hypothetical protein